ncbi:hypothetical protein DPMN_143719 [Dreissena polymorpha]|uniref:Uncharacterized protein n=1 Tax=Dreissena polymorpha TaxID=45954 RepID=A0A9D4JPK3_DREPO|nr:hypothetical protein DPMN_143719 [Dreissena polymorpha]
MRKPWHDVSSMCFLISVLNIIASFRGLTFYFIKGLDDPCLTAVCVDLNTTLCPEQRPQWCSACGRSINILKGQHYTKLGKLILIVIPR